MKGLSDRIKKELGQLYKGYTSPVDFANPDETFQFGQNLANNPATPLGYADDIGKAMSHILPVIGGVKMVNPAAEFGRTLRLGGQEARNVQAAQDIAKETEILKGLRTNLLNTGIKFAQGANPGTLVRVGGGF